MLWGLCYRLTGVAADADELVQETFVRALDRAPNASEDECARWLIRVATNLGLDRLRARRRRSYPGSWLPSPVDTPATEDANPGVEVDFERREAVSYAFLVALERLAPKARAVLILSDVFDYAASEVADLLDTSEANVRVLHHRARRRLEGTLPERRAIRDLAAATREVLERFLDCMIRQDARGIEALLTRSVRTITDAGGEYTALHAPLVGVSRVARFHLETARRRGPVSHVEMRMVNGLPALVIETKPLRPQMAPRVVLRCEIDDEGRICELHSILAPRKLTAVRFASTAETVRTAL
jgi:RNA polymerase sigma-70 factor (ECF subfamily)